MVEMSNRNIYVLLVKLQHVIILVKFQKNKNRKKEYLSFA